MDEFDEELRELKREIIETRGLIIKTNNLTNALSADLKSIAKRQQGYERRLVWNSATAYVVFVIVVFVALKLAWDARVDAVRAETEQTRQAVERLSRELKDAQKRDEDRAKAEAARSCFLRARSAGQARRSGRTVRDFEQRAAHQDRARRLRRRGRAGARRAVDRFLSPGARPRARGALARGRPGARRGAPLQGRRVSQPARSLQPRRLLPSPRLASATRSRS